MEYEKPPKRITRQEALKIADDEFSLLMRAYHAGEDGMVRCKTCGIQMEWRGTGIAHWGHYMRREFMWTRYDPNNGAVQCEGCNVGGYGMPKEMRVYLLGIHGEEEVERIEMEHKRMLHAYTIDLIDLSEKFKAKRIEIQTEKGLL